MGQGTLLRKTNLQAAFLLNLLVNKLPGSRRRGSHSPETQDVPESVQGIPESGCLLGAGAPEQEEFAAHGFCFWLCRLLAVCLGGIQQTPLSSAVFKLRIINTHRAGLRG